MSLDRTIPAKPLTFIRDCVIHRRIHWTYHVNMRLKERAISRKSILDSSRDYEIIEEYPKDKYLPSYLVYSEYSGRRFHVLFAVDVVEKNVRIVTAYYPNPEEWDEGLKKRRNSR